MVRPFFTHAHSRRIDLGHSGLTHNTTFPNYDCRSVASLYVEISHIYINSILWDAAYASWHDLDDDRKVFQLMSILFASGTLQHSQDYALPSWVPDWTFAVSEYTDMAQSYPQD